MSRPAFRHSATERRDTHSCNTPEPAGKLNRTKSDAGTPTKSASKNPAFNRSIGSVGGSSHKGGRHCAACERKAAAEGKMSFGFGGTQVGGGDLEDVTTEQLGFQSAAGEHKLRLLPSPWPVDSQPPPPASLLSIASSKGLVAAAGPEILVLAQSDKLRQTLREGEAGADKVTSFTPDATLQIPRVSQVAFSSDESCLVIAAEQGGGLAVYETNALTNGQKDPAFQVGTQGVRVRQLLPNPNPSDATAHLFGIVLETGQLLLADLKTKALTNNSSGSPVFHENVACACWSRLGKQIMAGKQDGTAVQIDPQGNVKAEIPRPSTLNELIDPRAQSCPLTSIYWIETNDFLIVHTPVYGQDDPKDVPAPDDSVYHIAQRPNPKSNEWSFNKVIEPTPPGFNGVRKPAHHFVQRLKDWPPNLDDTLFIISTLSTEVGMLTKSKIALDPEKPITGSFTTTLPDDTRRAGLPMSSEDGMSDTSPIGMALDLSVKEMVKKPIPNDETLDESPVPLPALYVLNNEGMLSIWYVVYNDSIRQRVAFPDLVAAGGPRALGESKQGTPAAVAAPAASPSSFGASAPSKPTPNAPSFGTSSSFGQPSTPGFGGASALGQKASPWGASSAAPNSGAGGSAFGKPAFGSATPVGGGSGSGFGSVGGLGMQNKQSVWGTPTTQAGAGSAFGQASKPFGGNASGASPFSAFAGPKKEGDAQKSSFSPFAAFGSQNKEQQKPGADSLASPFSSFSNENNKDQTKASPWATGSGFGGLAAQNDKKESAFGSGGSAFGTQGAQSGGSGFSFGKPSTVPESKEETMDDDSEEQKPETSGMGGSSGGGLFGAGTPFKLESTFKGDGSAKDDLPKPQNPGASLFGAGFGSALGEVGGKKSEDGPSTPIKAEPGTEEGPKLSDIPPAGETKGSTTPASPPKQEKQDEQKPNPFGSSIFATQQQKQGQEEKKPFSFGSILNQPKGEEPSKDSPKSSLFGTSSLFGSQQQKQAEPAKDKPVDGLQEALNQKPKRYAGDLPPMDGGPGGGGAQPAKDKPVDGLQEALNQKPKRLGPKSPAAPSQQEESTTPATDKKPTSSFTPAGFPNAPFFPPPNRSTQESPRSPSPVRSFTAPQNRSGFMQQPPKSSFAQSSKPAPSPAQPARIAVPPASKIERPPSPPKGPQTPTEGELLDEEDARVQEILASEPDPKKDLPDFLAHQNYVGETGTLGVGGQIEKVFRDINSMLDTLGLNAHFLKGFVKGQEHFKKEGQRDEEDLEDESSWTLEEGSRLSEVVKSIEERLEDGRLEDVPETVTDLDEEIGEINRARVKIAEVRKMIKSHSDPTEIAQQLSAPLPAETQGQQVELRQGVQRVQKLLGEVEEAMTLLRADLASAASASGQAGTKGSVKMPTVEAVMNTILKMTTMIEQKSGDIDVLEAQIKRLPDGLASLHLNEDYEDQLVAGLNGSKLLHGSSASPATPSRPRGNQRMLANGDAPGMSGMLGSRLRTPPSKSGRRSVMFAPEASKLGMSTASLSGSVMKKKMVDVTDEEVKTYQRKAGRRKGVTEALRAAVEGKGVKVVRMDK
ncbi:hypothetical protein D0860_00544 [Hortaea werneckii]|uniref:Nucleoporin Nup159/Nup146 N-terminal domain-containing protein n=1 Tax=Hortaea werneckii TaxID=91943 RepID=A0A3M7HVL7_HORWE|nr:hypothetical protein D0860_00544 [Hortaea werneckii]